ncbi:MAG TPA: dephospho-CoA kinase [Chthoniobacterales bacterium]|nr:dephospho-CoA kinase [Chthoniobacterales bacterium]
MPGIGITGGIATGKSTVTSELFAILRDKLEVALFSSDSEARRLTDSDLGVQEEIGRKLGAQLFDSEGRLRREQLRELVFQKPEARKELENILHPRIRAVWLGLVKEKKLLLAEIPLLFETKADQHLDLIVVTACSYQTQIERMVQKRSLPLSLVEQMINAQTPLADKMERAAQVVWTDCPLHITKLQTDRLAKQIVARYGHSNY